MLDPGVHYADPCRGNPRRGQKRTTTTTDHNVINHPQHHDDRYSAGAQPAPLEPVSDHRQTPSLSASATQAEVCLHSDAPETDGGSSSRLQAELRKHYQFSQPLVDLEELYSAPTAYFVAIASRPEQSLKGCQP